MIIRWKKTHDTGVKYYFFLFFVYTLSLFFADVKVGTFASLFMLYLILKLVVKKQIIRNYADVLVVIYILYNILTILWFPKGMLPMKVYLTEIAYSILPILFYFLKNTKNEAKLFTKYTVDAIYYSLFIGLILYIWAPQFYGHYLVYHGFSSNYKMGWIRQALQSFYGVTAVGTLSTIALLYSFLQVGEKKKIKDLLFFIFGLICLILSSRRSAWLAFAIVLVYFHYLFYLKLKKLREIHFLAEIFTLVGGMICLNLFFNDAFNAMIRRINTMSSAVNERAYNWIDGINSVNNLVIGKGLGSMNHESALFGNIGVFDSSYVKMLCEVGLIGCVLFGLIVFLALFNGIKSEHVKHMEVGIIIVFLVQAIGSNVFAFQVLAPLFWYSIGQCIKNSRRSEDENIRTLSTTIP
ncbi:O-antigen ligase [Fusibacter sp. 3D3]|uniref:O-antigen ligase family protein n=1 Tax=Fusibacter sp. 3D3 TaxID=1048380 RepID=UPI000852F3DE|nr:O-antigen ligase family protein [Fusibacter sp. 3D3]GAU77785.1 membrane protein of EXOQ family [Fusibacter sp. 3D3]